MKVNPTSLTVGEIIFIPIYLTFRPVVNFYQFDFEIVYVIMLL
jgi:hypothetical protein